MQQVRAQKAVRVPVKEDPPLPHKDHPVHGAVEHILQPVLNDDDRAACAFLDLVDELHRLFSGGRVQIGQGLVKQQHIHPGDHNAS